MKKFLSVIILFVISILLISNYSPQGNFKYIGVNKCAAMCHRGDSRGNQLEIWKSSKHSNAFKTLETEKASQIAKEKGFTTNASETPQCIKCHVLGKELNPDELMDSFDKTDGVQCESCHGPGSEYKALSIMNDKQKAIENGLIVPSNKDDFCTNCHNQESPTFKGFNFTEMWVLIKHPKPSN